MEIEFYFAKPLAHSSTIDRSPTVQRPTNTLLVIWMKGRFVIDRDLFTRIDVSQCYEQDVVVKNLHKGVWSA